MSVTLILNSQKLGFLGLHPKGSIKTSTWLESQSMSLGSKSL